MARKKRNQAKSVRNRFLYTDVTPQEFAEIRQYCRANHVSVSQFIAELLLNEAKKTKEKQPEKLTLQIELTRRELDKLELLTRLHQKKSPGEFVRDVLEPEFQAQRLHAPLETKMLRYYLSADEHKMIMKHIQESGISARNYAAMLAVRAVRQTAKKRKR